MDGAREEFLARPALAVDQHRRVGRRHLLYLVHDLLHLATLSDYLRKAELFSKLFFQEYVFGCHARSVERPLDQHEQMVGVERFGQEVIGPLLYRLDRGLDRTERGHHDHRQKRVVLLHRLQHLETVLLRKLEVRQHQTDALIGELPDAFGAVFGRGHLVAFSLQGLLQHVEHAFLVFDNEYSISHVIYRRGSMMLNAVPFPSVLATSILPPWEVTILCTRASPIPTPVSFKVKKGRNIFFNVSDGMPMPVSRTTILRSRFVRASMVSVPPSGMASTAF